MDTNLWRVLVADDEPAARRGVRQLLAAFPNFRIVGECRNGREVLQGLDTLSPHVIFLDIQMPGLDGFEVIKRRTPARMPVVVFLTAYDAYALKAFEAQALDYLVKPVSQSRFNATMNRVVVQLRREMTEARPPALVVSVANGTRVLRLDDIEWMESADNYARLWVNGKSFLLRESLNALEERVRAHGFARAHRQALVRVSAIRQLVRGENDAVTVVLTSGMRVPVSRRRRAEFARLVTRVSREGI